jgi:hypothetical protein
MHNRVPCGPFCEQLMQIISSHTGLIICPCSHSCITCVLFICFTDCLAVSAYTSRSHAPHVRLRCAVSHDAMLRRCLSGVLVCCHTSQISGVLVCCHTSQVSGVTAIVSHTSGVYIAHTMCTHRASSVRFNGQPGNVHKAHSC